jgi:hypothetical protein
VTTVVPSGQSWAELSLGQRNEARALVEDAIDPSLIPAWVQSITGAPPELDWHEAQARLNTEWAADEADDDEWRRGRAREDAIAATAAQYGITPDSVRSAFGKRLSEAAGRKLADETVAATAADAAGIRPLSAMAMTATEMICATAPPALVEGVIDGGGMSMLVGTRGTGKSFLALDMALCIATGRRWGTHATSATKGRVLYLVGEGGGRAFGIRIEAWCLHNGVDPADLDGRFLAVDGAVPFMSSRWDELVALAAEFDPDHVIVDTLSRHAVGLDENSNTDAATGVAKAEALRDRAGCSVMVLHHPAKGVTGGVNAGRGAGAWEAAIDTVLTLDESDEGTVVVEATKQKHRPEGIVGHWRIDSVRVSPNGTWDTSAVPVPVDPTTMPSAGDRSTKAAAVEAWLIEAVTADPGQAVSRYYRATGVVRAVEVGGQSVSFSKADAEAAIDRLVATGALVRNEENRRRVTLSVGVPWAAGATS